MIASDQRQRPVAARPPDRFGSIGTLLAIALAQLLPTTVDPPERSWRTELPGPEVESPSRPGVFSVLDVSFRPPVDRWRLRLRGPVQVGAAPTRSERAWRRPTHFQRSRIGLPRARRGR